MLSGDDWLTLAVIAAGGDGLISVASNEVPGQMTAMVALLLSGEFEKAREWHYRLLPLMDANFLETNPAPVKAALALAGRISNVLRLPLVPVTENDPRDTRRRAEETRGPALVVADPRALRAELERFAEAFPRAEEPAALEAFRAAQGGAQRRTGCARPSAARMASGAPTRG